MLPKPWACLPDPTAWFSFGTLPNVALQERRNQKSLGSGHWQGRAVTARMVTVWALGGSKETDTLTGALRRQIQQGRWRVAYNTNWVTHGRLRWASREGYKEMSRRFYV